MSLVDADQIMSGATGKTYGFGRVSPRVEPSPYSPLHMPSRIPGSHVDAVSRPRRRPRKLASIVALVVLLVIIATLAGVFTWGGRTPPSAPAARPHVAPEAPVALTEEAARLPRSAIAVSRATPRQRS